MPRTNNPAVKRKRKRGGVMEVMEWRRGVLKRWYRGRRRERREMRKRQ